MRRFAVVLGILLLTITINSSALEGSAASFGTDLGKEEKESIVKIIGVENKIPEVTISSADEKKYLKGFIKENETGSKAVTAVCITAAPAGSGIRVEATNLSLVTPEMISSAMITAGIKDITARIASPYKVSGSASLVYVIKAYEKLSGHVLPENAKIAANGELAVMADLGQKYGMQKSLQFINEIKKAIIKNKLAGRGKISKVIDEQETRFDIKIDSYENDKTLSVMEKVSELGLTIDSLKVQQKNISPYIDDLSKTANKKSLLKTIISKIMMFFKMVSLALKGDGK